MYYDPSGRNFLFLPLATRYSLATSLYGMIAALNFLTAFIYVTCASRIRKKNPKARVGKNPTGCKSEKTFR